MPLPEVNVFDLPLEQIEATVDRNVRSKFGCQPKDYLASFLSVARPLASAKQDGTWGEFEKEFAIIIRRLVDAERRMDELDELVAQWAVLSPVLDGAITDLDVEARDLLRAATSRTLSYLEGED